MTPRGMTAELVAGVAVELDAHRGRHVRAVHQDAPLRFRVELRGEGVRVDWVIDLEPAFPRTHVAAHHRAPPQPSALAHALRGLLAGAAVAKAGSVPGDRALCVRFTTAEGPRTLWVELFGGHANLYVLDAEDRVLLTPRGDVAVRRGAAQGADFVPVEARPETGSEPAPDASVVVRGRVAAWRREREFTSARRRLSRYLRSQAARAARTIKKLEDMATRVQEAETYQRRGELLQGAFHLVRPGLRSVRVPDYTVDPPAEVEVPLEPDLQPGEQIAACFRKARRRRRAADEATRRLPELRTRVQAAEDAREALEDLTALDELDRVASALPQPLRQEARAALRAPQRTSPRTGPTTAAPWHTFVSADGWRILVGRDARGNDRLTLTVAKPWDLFLHVRAASGSHVIVPTPRGKTVPRDTLLDAAELACVYSERREAEHNEVDYALRRYVRKAKGAAPGAVLVERAKTLTVRRDEARRARLQAARKRHGNDRTVT